MSPAPPPSSPAPPPSSPAPRAPAARPGSPGWRFYLDRGGTFTDLVALDPAGGAHVAKLLSEDPARYADATVAGIRQLMGLAPGEPLPTEAIEEVRLGTTVATNALLERAGVATALMITAGFGDALRIGDQHRPRLFDRRIVLPEPLYQEVLEVHERIGASGEVLVPLDLERTAGDLAELRAAGIGALAVVLMHGYRHPAHERAVAGLARRLGFAEVCCSHEVSPLPRLVPRGDTTVVDAYLSPALRRYLDGLRAELGAVPVVVMQSGGGLAGAEVVRAKDAILSGPAGGIVGMAATSSAAGEARVIGFDMGGTSTDVSHFAGEHARVGLIELAGLRIRAPTLEIHTVAAGGGSILRLERARQRVGPSSAGADPGPACYGRGGPATVTDANVVLGRIQPGWFPAVFGAHGDGPLDVAAAHEALAELAAEVSAAGPGHPHRPEEVAEGFLEVAVTGMAEAIKQVSLRRGHDVTDYALCCFGGAGGQHACAVAEQLGIATVLVPPRAGVLSAIGVALAARSATEEASLECRLDKAGVTAARALAVALERGDREILERGLGHARADGADRAPRRFSSRTRARLRFEGTDSSIEVELAPPEQMRADFERRYRTIHSFVTPDRPIVIDAVSVELTLASEEPITTRLEALSAGGRASTAPASGPEAEEAGVGAVEVYLDGAWRSTRLVERARLVSGTVLEGPALVVEDGSTTLVGTGWRCEVLATGHLRLTPDGAPADRPPIGEARRHDAPGERPDPVRLEIFAELFMSIAEQMGVRLQASARSVNIKERLDFSCAVFDATGALVANAPHMPVHLGSMGESVKAVLEASREDLASGDAYVVNNPFRGGTHLPDVTVVSPCFVGGELLAWVASRGHHAEIGGLTPGSMPPSSRSVEEEGVLFDAWRLVRGGELRETETLAQLRSGPWPSRQPEVNLADLRAQVAANQRGLDGLTELTDRYGAATMAAYMGHVMDDGEESLRRVIAELPGGRYTYRTDRGAVIEVAVRPDQQARRVVVDFTGSSPQLPDNFNAPRSVTMAAVLYVFRTLVEGDLPLNDGCRRAIEVILPGDCFLAARYPAATVAGNVETSQAVVSALYGALGLLAEGSGTMNNLTFGNERYQYYETVASGAGAGWGFDGADAVQTHMTNTRLTDPEILEARLPVIIEGFEIRRGSGGAGRWHGGDGTRRRLRFLEAMTLSLLTSHRLVAPFGLAGGEPGALGRQVLERADGSRRELAGCDSVEVAAGDLLVLETPGGGGFGDPARD